MLRLWIVSSGLLLSSAVCAQTVLTCDQIVASAQAGLEMRDRGASLNQVMAETEKGDLRERFKPDELAMIRRAVRLTFTSEISIYELAETCAASKGGSRR
ncbi:MAG: hypothetical protein K2X06_08935 [Burkholderiales bacterium]|nr:hypothetical protein [Burkholderiales bacterium]